jgi:hypothetical protein
MKKSLAILLIVLFAFTQSADAQKRKYNYYDKGYWGNIEAVGGVVLSGGGGGSDIGISTVHGGRVGHGIAMGIGAGMYIDINNLYYAWNIPIFLETKYSPMKSNKSPFVSLRVGLSVTDYLTTGFYLSPAVGVNLGRLSLFARYGFNLFPMSVDIEIPELDMDVRATANIKTHAMSIGVAVNF